jgi:Aspartyl protease
MKDKQNWSNQIYNQILKYRGEWIFYSYQTEKIVSHNKILSKAREEALKKERQDNIVSLFVKEDWGEKYLLPIYFKTVDVHPWKPLYDVKLSIDKFTSFNERMLVDSGADISVISFEIGLELGLKPDENDRVYEAGGVGGGKLKYVSKEIYLQIDENPFVRIPVAWVQDNRFNEMIIGREVVFDNFDIEFKQADEEIIFKYRDK